MYDGLGRRRSKTIGGTTIQFLYDRLNPVQELSGGTPSANLLTGLGIDEFLTRTDATGVRNYLTDALGSSVGLTDGSGTVQTEYTYEPFGNVSTSGASTSNTFAFTGREADGTGLYFYRARYYSPWLQRFVSQDPTGLASGDINFFAYVWNAPTNFTDPNGLGCTNWAKWGRIFALLCSLYGEGDPMPEPQNPPHKPQEQSGPKDPGKSGDGGRGGDGRGGGGRGGGRGGSGGRGGGGAGGRGGGRIPGGFPLLPIIVNPCLLDPSICHPTPGRAPCVS